MRMMMKNLEKAAVYVIHGDGENFLYVSKSLASFISESDKKLNTTDRLISYLTKKMPSYFISLSMYNFKGN